MAELDKLSDMKPTATIDEILAPIHPDRFKKKSSVDSPAGPSSSTSSKSGSVKVSKENTASIETENIVEILKNISSSVVVQKVHKSNDVPVSVSCGNVDAEPKVKVETNVSANHDAQEFKRAFVEIMEVETSKNQDVKMYGDNAALSRYLKDEEDVVIEVVKLKSDQVTKIIVDEKIEEISEIEFSSQMETPQDTEQISPTEISISPMIDSHSNYEPDAIEEVLVEADSTKLQESQISSVDQYVSETKSITEAREVTISQDPKPEVDFDMTVVEEIEDLDGFKVNKENKDSKPKIFFTQTPPMERPWRPLKQREENSLSKKVTYTQTRKIAEEGDDSKSVTVDERVRAKPQKVSKRNNQLLVSKILAKKKKTHTTEVIWIDDDNDPLETTLNKLEDSEKFENVDISESVSNNDTVEVDNSLNLNESMSTAGTRSAAKTAQNSITNQLTGNKAQLFCEYCLKFYVLEKVFKKHVKHCSMKPGIKKEESTAKIVIETQLSVKSLEVYKSTIDIGSSSNAPAINEAELADSTVLINETIVTSNNESFKITEVQEDSVVKLEKASHEIGSSKEESAIVEPARTLRSGPQYRANPFAKVTIQHVCENCSKVYINKKNYKKHTHNCLMSRRIKEEKSTAPIVTETLLSDETLKVNEAEPVNSDEVQSDDDILKYLKLHKNCGEQESVLIKLAEVPHSLSSETQKKTKAKPKPKGFTRLNKQKISETLPDDYVQSISSSQTIKSTRPASLHAQKTIRAQLTGHKKQFCCEFCSKLYVKELYYQQHIKICPRNPNLKADEPLQIDDDSE